MERPQSPVEVMRLRYQVHGGHREIFRKEERHIQMFDDIHASAVYMAVGSSQDDIPPQLVGSHKKRLNDHHNDEWGLVAIKIALTHALETVMSRLQDEAGGIRVRVRIYSDNKRGLRLMRKAVRQKGLERYWTQRGTPRLHFNLLHETFTLHQKIEHVVGSQGVVLDYRFLAGNQRPYFDQNIVIGKCNELLDQMEEEYYGSGRWNQVSCFVKPYDCHGWLRGYCRHGPEKCLYQHRPNMVATVPWEPQSTPDRKKSPACKYWAQGRCFNGTACPFSHEGEGSSLKAPVCIYWKKGQCLKGDTCKFSHGEAEVEARAESIETLLGLVQRVNLDEANSSEDFDEQASATT